MRTTDGTSYQTFGSRGAPAIVLIHGLGLCQEIWKPLVPKLAASYFVISYDLYGHGDSNPSEETASLSIYARQIVTVLDALEIARADIVGFSIGGMINRRFALDYPDRLNRLVILNSPHDRGADAQVAVEERAKTVRDQGALATMDAALERWFTDTVRENHSEITHRVVDWRMKADGESYAQAAWVLAAGVTELIAPDPAINVPTLVMTCENDVGSTPDMSRMIAAEIDGAKLRIIPDLKHLGLMEKPTLFADAILRFLVPS